MQYDASNYLMPRVPLLCNGRFECYKNSRLGLETLAIRELSRSILNLKRLERHRSKSNVSPAGGASQVPEESIMGRRLYVGNLAWTVTDQDLQDVFSEAGPVDSSQVIMDRATNRSRGSACCRCSVKKPTLRSSAPVATVAKRRRQSKPRSRLRGSNSLRSRH